MYECALAHPRIKSSVENEINSGERERERENGSSPFSSDSQEKDEGGGGGGRGGEERETLVRSEKRMRTRSNASHQSFIGH